MYIVYHVYWDSRFDCIVYNNFNIINACMFLYLKLEAQMKNLSEFEKQGD